MNVLVIKNIAAEGPGTIEDHLRDRGIPATVIDLRRGDLVPDLGSFTHLVIMGGPMAVYEMHLHQHLKNEALLIEQAIKAGKHVLGVCLGAQMIAHVLGARVYAGDQKEIGWYEVGLSDDAMQDPAMAQLAMEGRQAAQVFQWHGDTFDLPTGAVRLASSALFQNQAFRFSDRVYALQFHIEVTPSIVSGWLEHEQGIDLRTINAQSDGIYPAYHSRAQGFYSAFFKP
jgi:GMP synthase (glutamine-hydrolysing)